MPSPWSQGAANFLQESNWSLSESYFIVVDAFENFLQELLSSRSRAIMLQGKKVKMLDLEGEHVATWLVMSIDKNKVVMGRQIETAYYEFSIISANKPEAPLFIKDQHRKTIKDAVGSHILWLTKYVIPDAVNNHSLTL